MYIIHQIRVLYVQNNPLLTFHVLSSNAQALILGVVSLLTHCLECLFVAITYHNNAYSLIISPI